MNMMATIAPHQPHVAHLTKKEKIVKNEQLAQIKRKQKATSFKAAKTDPVHKKAKKDAFLSRKSTVLEQANILVTASAQTPEKGAFMELAAVTSIFFQSHEKEGFSENTRSCLKALKHKYEELAQREKVYGAENVQSLNCPETLKIVNTISEALSSIGAFIFYLIKKFYEELGLPTANKRKKDHKQQRKSYKILVPKTVKNDLKQARIIA